MHNATQTNASAPIHIHNKNYCKQMMILRRRQNQAYDITYYSFKLKTIQWTSTNFLDLQNTEMKTMKRVVRLFVWLVLLSFLLFYFMKVASCVSFVINVQLIIQTRSKAK